MRIGGLLGIGLVLGRFEGYHVVEHIQFHGYHNSHHSWSHISRVAMPRTLAGVVRRGGSLPHAGSG